ncbi:hypothetical protein AX16_010301 [Volvariella volvacea WC 439]|nr:hypothetical protein AX16_010301 [Volvariella volvacea WC 439]
MARSAALNPASVPFFPGGLRAHEEDTGRTPFNGHSLREQDRRSSLSVSPLDYRSPRSSPSPSQDTRSTLQHLSTPPITETTSPSPTIRHVEAGRPYPGIEYRAQRESSMFGVLNTLPEAEDALEATSTESSPQTLNQPFVQQGSGHEHLSTPPAPLSHTLLTHQSGFASVSPVSSLDSASQFAASVDQGQNFEFQLRSSPFILSLVERLVQYEATVRDLKINLDEVTRKVDILVERSLGSTSQPEFKDPFAVGNGQNFSPISLPRPSIGGIAPNQPAPSDDITTISQRLNTLTTSVGQLLSLQRQQMQSTTDLRNNSVVALSSQQELAPNQVVPPTMQGSSLLNHGLPSRPDLRTSRINQPMRTWSAGNLDLPLRPNDPSITRQDSGLGRDKRRSVSGLLRRDSSAILDAQADGRDSGPVISKWEQLQLAPELLRSLSKFGLGPPNKIQQRALPFLLRGADIIAQAPPTQERIAAYVIPAIQIAVTHISSRVSGPFAILLSTTVDQATQAQRMIRDLGGPLGVRSALGVGTTTASNDLAQELRLLHQNMPHIVCGTPQKLHALFTSPGGLSGSEVRFLVLDEVDQLIARNLHDFVFNIVKLIPPPRSRPLPALNNTASTSPSQPTTTASLDNNNASTFPTQSRRFSTVTSIVQPDNPIGNPVERQTALFSNTVPQDVLNLATAIQLREPVRVLVRRDGNVTQSDSNQGSRGLRQFYLYLAFPASGRADPATTAAGGGLGIIGSGRGASNPESVQAREWKLDALVDLFDEVEISQAIVHVGGVNSVDAVSYKLKSRGYDPIPIHGDMTSAAKLSALNKFRSPAPAIMRQTPAKVLVVYDVQVKPPDVPHVPLIINYDLPKAVEEYAHRVAPAIAPNYARAGVVVNFVTATGGDVEMLRSIECFYKIKCPEVPMSLREIV